MSLQDRMLAVIAGIYDAALDRAEWALTLRHLSDLLGGTSASLHFDSQRGGRVIADYRISAEAKAEYRSYYWRVDPVRTFMIGAPPGIYSSRQIVGETDSLRTEFYDGWGRRHDAAFCIQALAFSEAEVAAIVAVCRSSAKDDFDAEQRKLLGLLMPHLERALRFEMRKSAANARASLLGEALDRWSSAVVVVDKWRRIHLTNKAADGLLAQADGIRLQNDRLCAATPAQTAALQHLIGRAAGGGVLESGFLLLSRPSHRHALAVEAVAFSGSHGLVAGQQTVLLFIADPELIVQAAEQRLRELYGLTRAEAALTNLVSKGGGLKLAARTLGIAPSTARTHLQRAFEKTGTSRQVQLASLVAASCRDTG